jgi:SAM-dependent MidA family methyltransferase
VNVAAALRTRIARGPTYFDEFMDIALYGPGGFFASGPLRSAATGDFLTSPEVSPWFGKTIGRFVAAKTEGWEKVQVVEVGGGSGSLVEPLLDELPLPAEAWAVEASPMARDSLGAVLPAERVVAGLEELPDSLAGVLVANELIDNLPVALAVKHGSGWVEHAVDVDGEVFVFVEAPARPDVTAWAERFGGKVPDGGIVEVQLAATAWLRRAIDLIDGFIVLIDYGGAVEDLEPRRQQGTLRTYRGHHLGPDPLLEPGETDITVDVNFTALQAVSAERGCVATVHRQDDFLAAWGLREVVAEMRRRELELARAGETMQQLAVKSERIAAETLLHPRGLGDFRVLIIET